MDNYFVAHLQKFKSNDIKGLEVHFERSSENLSNKDIDRNRTGLNVDLLGNGTPLHKRVSELVDGRYNPKGTKLRADAVQMCSVVVSASADVFKTLSNEAVRRYFEEATEWLCKEFGRENAVGAYIHMDEATPHLHFAFVPLTEDNRLCAKEIVDRNRLQRLQEALPRYLQEAGYKIQRGIEGSPVTHIDTKDWKREELIKQVVLEELMSIANIPVKDETNWLGKKTGNLVVKREDLQTLQDTVKSTAINRLELRRQYAEQLRDLRQTKADISKQVKKLEDLRDWHKKEADRLQKEAEAVKESEKRLRIYKRQLEAQDKDLELQRMIDDAKRTEKLLEERQLDIMAKEERLAKAEEEAERRTEEAAKRAVKKELEKQGTLKGFESAVLQTLKSENPDLYNQLIQNEKIKSLAESTSEAKKEIKKSRGI